MSRPELTLYPDAVVGREADAVFAPTETSPLHDATGLTAGGKLARIHLNGQFYALRITRQGKLILTK